MGGSKRLLPARHFAGFLWPARGPLCCPVSALEGVGGAARHLGWSRALEGAAMEALHGEFIATDEGADFWNFAQGVLGLVLL